MHPLFSLALVIILIIAFIRFLHRLQQLPFFRKNLLLGSPNSGINVISITKIDDHYKIANISIYGEEKIILLGTQTALVLKHGVDLTTFHHDEKGKQ